jgi:hypothetical protein
LLLPPTTVLVVSTTLAATVSLLSGSHIGTALGAAAVAAQLVYLASAVWYCEARGACFRLLPQLPHLIGWKLAVYASVITRPAPQSWLRTSRVPGAGHGSLLVKPVDRARAGRRLVAA